MGWHYTLTFTCTVHPDYLDFIRRGLLQRFADSIGETDEDIAVYEGLSKSYRDLVDIWNSLGIGRRFREYLLEGNVLTCQISKKVTSHCGDLRADMESFMRDIIVPLSTEISSCHIDSDDYGEMCHEYSDAELRNIQFCLQDKIKSVEHVYSEDGAEIIETRVVYKHSIKPIQFLDLNRAYGRGM
jgi:hypothetical protein